MVFLLGTSLVLMSLYLYTLSPPAPAGYLEVRTKEDVEVNGISTKAIQLGKNSH